MAVVVPVVLWPWLVVGWSALFVLCFPDWPKAIARSPALHVRFATHYSRRGAFCIECVDAVLDACGSGDASASSPPLPRGRRWGGSYSQVILVASAVGWAAF